MAKDATDKSTVDMLPVTKKRGRPTTGTALSSADRQRKYRAKKIGQKHIEVYLSPAADIFVTSNKNEGESVSDCINRLLLRL